MKHTDISRHYGDHNFRFVRSIDRRGISVAYKKTDWASAMDWVIVAFAAMIIVALLLEVPFAVLTEWMK